MQKVVCYILGLAICFFIIISFTPFCYSAEMEQKNHLFILSGQSNMLRLDPEISFTPSVKKEFDKVTIVKEARGGAPIRRWYREWNLNQNVKIGDLYKKMLKKIKSRCEIDKFDTITFIWMQGERDAKEKHGNVYAESLKGVVKQLQKDLGRKNINVVIGRISDFDLNNKRYKHWTLIRKKQVEVAESNPLWKWVNTDDLNGSKDKLHYTDEGYKKLGKRFAEAAIDLIKNHSKK